MAFGGYDALKLISEKSEFENYTIKVLFPKIKDYEYGPSRLFIGWGRNGRRVFVNLKTSKIILIVGKRGCGKTLLMRAMMNRLYLSGHVPVILTDIKGEYNSSKEPVQSKFKHLLDEFEKPIGFPVKSYHPVFLKKHARVKQFDNVICQLSLSMITEYDLMTILGYDLETSSAKRELLQRVWKKVEKKEIFTFNELIDKIWQDLDAIIKTKESVISSLKTAISQGVLGDEFADFSWTDDVIKGYVPVLNLIGFGKMRTSGYPSAFISVVAKDVIDGKKTGVIERGVKIYYFIDEAHRWIHALGSSSAKKTIINIMREERGVGVSLVCATQTIGGLDEAVRKQASIIFVPWNIDSPTVIGIMKDVGLYERYGKFVDRLNQNLQTLKKWEWVMIDCDNRDIKIISKIAGPLSHHQEEI